MSVFINYNYLYWSKLKVCTLNRWAMLNSERKKKNHTFSVCAWAAEGSQVLLTCHKTSNSNTVSQLHQVRSWAESYTCNYVLLETPITFKLRIFARRAFSSPPAALIAGGNVNTFANQMFDFWASSAFGRQKWIVGLEINLFVYCGNDKRPDAGSLAISGDLPKTNLVPDDAN